MFPDLSTPNLCECGHPEALHRLTPSWKRADCGMACDCRRFRAVGAAWWIVLLLCLLMVFCLAASGVLVYRSIKHGGF